MEFLKFNKKNFAITDYKPQMYMNEKHIFLKIYEETVIIFSFKMHKQKFINNNSDIMLLSLKRASIL